MLFQVFQILSSSSVKPHLLQEALFDCSTSQSLCPFPQLCSGFLLSQKVFSYVWSMSPPSLPGPWQEGLGPAPFPWGLLQMTVIWLYLVYDSPLTMHRASLGHCHFLSTLWGLPSEAACKRQLPSPVVAKGRSRLQLVHTVDHQFRRPGTETHI